MSDRKILDNYYGFSGMSDTAFEKVVSESRGNIEQTLENINNAINNKVMRILSLCNDEEINTINHAEDFDDIIEVFEGIKGLCDNEYDILEERFHLSKKQSEK